MAHWWRRDELLALLEAWEETIAAPRDRDDLTHTELERLNARFDALRPRDSAPIAIHELENHRQRLVRTFLFLRAFNAESARAGRPTWFQLPPQQQDDLRRLNGRLGDLAVVAQDEFQYLARICEEVPPQVQQVSRPMGDEMKAAAEALAGLPMFRSSNQERPTLSLSSSPVKQKKDEMSESDMNSGEEEEDSEYAPTKRGRKDSDLDYTPPKGKGKAKGKLTSKWSKRDEKLLISAWHEVVTTLTINGFEGSFASRNDGLRLNSLIHQRYVELCEGKAPRTNQSTGAKKHAIMMAFRSLRGVLRTLASLSERPNWFGMTPDERMELQKMHGHHNEHACYIGKDTYQRLGEIDRAQRAVSTPVTDALRSPTSLDELLGRTNNAGDARKKVGKKSGKGKFSGGTPRNLVVAEKSSESEDDGFLDGARSGMGENSSRAANSQTLVVSRRPRSAKTGGRRPNRDFDDVVATKGGSPPKRRRTGLSRTGLSDAKWVTRLLDAQTQRFEALLAEFQEERRQERQHNVEIILEALKLRSASAQKSDQPAPFVEALVEKQRQHLLGLFNQLQDERSQEREQARMLLRELGGPPILSSPDQEHKE